MLDELDVLHYHIGNNASSESGDAFHTTFKDLSVGMVRLYIKNILI